MEDNNNYTYTYRREKKKEQQRLRLIVLIVFGILALICILAGIVSGRNAAKKAHENEISVSESLAAESTSTEVNTTDDPSPYKVGDYTVETGGYSLKFREDHTTDSKVYLEIKDTTKLSIEEIYHDEAAATSGSGIEYWGKTTYKGYTGWVAMNYLKKAYSDNIVTPDEVSSTEESTTAAPESTTAAPESTTEPTTQKPAESTTAEPTTAAPAESTTASTTPTESTTAASNTGGYTPGDYIVNTGDYTLTFRKSASRNGEVIFGIEDGVKLTVTRIVETSDAQNKYWGEVTYKGQTGYVSMAYLKKAN